MAQYDEMQELPWSELLVILQVFAMQAEMPPAGARGWRDAALAEIGRRWTTEPVTA